MVLDTQIDKRLDKAIIGVIQSPYIPGPILPGLTAAQEQRLAQSEIKAGDIIVDYAAEATDGKIEHIDVLHAPAANIAVLGFTDAHNKILHHIDRPGFFARLFGIKPRPSINSRLMGSMVIKAASEDDNEMLVQKLANRRCKKLTQKLIINLASASSILRLNSAGYFTTCSRVMSS